MALVGHIVHIRTFYEIYTNVARFRFLFRIAKWSIPLTIITIMSKDKNLDLKSNNKHYISLLIPLPPPQLPISYFRHHLNSPPYHSTVFHSFLVSAEKSANMREM